MKNEKKNTDGVSARILWLTPRYVIAVSLFDYLKQRFMPQNDTINDLPVELAVEPSS